MIAILVIIGIVVAIVTKNVWIGLLSLTAGVVLIEITLTYVYRKFILKEGSDGK